MGTNSEPRYFLSQPMWSEKDVPRVVPRNPENVPGPGDRIIDLLMGVWYQVGKLRGDGEEVNEVINETTQLFIIPPRIISSGIPLNEAGRTSYKQKERMDRNIGHVENEVIELWIHCKEGKGGKVRTRNHKLSITIEYRNISGVYRVMGCYGIGNTREFNLNGAVGIFVFRIAPDWLGRRGDPMAFSINDEKDFFMKQTPNTHGSLKLTAKGDHSTSYVLYGKTGTGKKAWHGVQKRASTATKRAPSKSGRASSVQ
ncbi:hypothetical protein BDZ94DRAFT_1237704 [Collybia nuda]|uniref:Uncharacterized protein n=1 Tax=Collybia nuda TaxID=64659 RepID=A0A9P6CD67_9AGAR|nr:hypothetical protein BDZ94DRAFT_1237704 [Collybia nuda]